MDRSRETRFAQTQSVVTLRAIHFIAPEHSSTTDGLRPSPTVRGEHPVPTRGEISTPDSVLSLYHAAGPEVKYNSRSMGPQPQHRDGSDTRDVL